MAKRKASRNRAIGELHKEILVALGKCGYLSVPHFNQLGLCSERHLRNKLKELQGAWGRAYINTVKCGKQGGGSKAYWYYLTRHGKELCARL